MSESQSGACSNGSPPILFLAGMFVSNVGRNAYFVCMTWIVLGSTNSVRSVTVLLLTGTLAQFLSSGIIGFLADATDRRRLAIGLDLARAVIVVLTGLPVAVDAGVPGLYLSVALFSVADRGYLSAMQSIIPFLTGKERAVNTNSASYLMMQSGTFVGALFSGFLLHYLPYDLAISSLGIVFCLSAVITFLMRLPAFLRPVYGKCDGQWKHYISIRYWSENNQGVAVLCYSLVFGVGTVINALLAAYVLKVLSGDAFLFGRLESAWALGAVLVCLVLSVGPRMRAPLPELPFCLLMSGIGLILLWTFPNALSAGITLLVLGGFYNLGRISMDVQIQRTVDIASIGRAKGVINTVATGCGLFIYTLIWLNGDRLASSSVIAIYGLVVGTVGGLALTAPRTKFKAHRPGRGDHR